MRSSHQLLLDLLLGLRLDALAELLVDARKHLVGCLADLDVCVLEVHSNVVDEMILLVRESAEVL